MKVFVPPIKSQGIKSKLVGWIASNIEDLQYDRWVEPFMGTGVVAFNVRPKKALLCDSNPHLIRFYNAIKDKKITSGIVRKHLTEESKPNTSIIPLSITPNNTYFPNILFPSLY